jgi:hypothetical protein
MAAIPHIWARSVSSAHLGAESLELATFRAQIGRTGP